MRTIITVSILFLLGLFPGKASANESTEPDQITMIAKNYRHWILGSDTIDYSNPFVQVRYKEMMKNVRAAYELYERDKNQDGHPDILFDTSISVPQSTKQLSSFFSKYLFPLSLGYHLKPAEEYGLNNPYYHNKQVRERLLTLFNNLHQQGWKSGIDIGVLHMNRYPETGYIGYYSGMSLRCLGYALSVFLNQDLLQNEGLLKRELNTLDFISKEIGPQYNTPILWQQKGFNTDAVRSMFNVRWCYILSLPANAPGRQEQMTYFSKMLNKSLQIADGWADMIKPDYLGYHHQAAYLNAYAPHGYHAASIFVHQLNNSPYQVGNKAINNLTQALLHSRIYCNLYDAPRSAAGRFPDRLNTLVKNIPAFVYLSQIQSPHQQELKGAFMRLWQPDVNDFQKDYLKQADCAIVYTASLGEIEQSATLAASGIQPEPSPNGFWYYPYGGLGIYRQANWQVSFSGCSRYIWDYESSKRGENQFGRFARAGVLRILAGGHPVSAASSGYVEKGWHWCRLPGATTIEIPFNNMKQDTYKDSHRKFTSESYLGGLHIDENTAMVSLKYNAPLYNNTPINELKANKSFFFFDDYIVALGTNIKGQSKNDYPVQTTLFQNGMDNIKVETTVNGKVHKNAWAKTFTNESVSLCDAQGHAYFVPHAPTLCIERTRQSAPDDENKATHTGSFTSARLMHGAAPNDASYLYFIQVHGGKEGAQSLARHHQDMFTVSQQDSIAHIVSYQAERVSAYAILKSHDQFQDKWLQRSNTPCLLMIKEQTNERIRLAIQNPDLGKLEKTYSYKRINRDFAHAPSTVQPVEITLQGIWKLAARDQRIDNIEHRGNQTLIRFNCFDGQAIQVELQKITSEK
ncbi:MULTISPECIES: chondroitinase family polysaccharide lyase [unclassified Carboxylicivirga]|uniref:chondroitinase family polysaccharide lyase n=1 Tax=Carboxylicivirga TaxID=1628153 RepID=UPI003D3544DA